jgi:hypothetical protein
MSRNLNVILSCIKPPNRSFARFFAQITAGARHVLRNCLGRAGFLARAALATLALAGAVPASHAVIPAAERTALQALYTSTNGGSWTNNANWNGIAGSECTWFGITCNGGETNVLAINLNSNNLSGTLPAIGAFTALLTFNTNNNSLTGSIPTLSSLTALRNFYVLNNNLTGSIPSLSALTQLVEFRVDSNQLTGAIPPLTGLTQLRSFIAQVNQLSGPIPSLAGLTALQDFEVYNNQLTGSIPSLSGLTALSTFWAFNNQLTGSIPALTGLTTLDEFDVSGNQLTGAIPSLAGLADLNSFRVANNQLTGAVPTAPPNLDPGASTLCPNMLTPSVDPVWDAATGQTPWSFACGGSSVSYTVTPNLGANGTSTPNTPQAVAAGGSITFMTVPNAGFAVATVGITGPCNLGNTAVNEYLVSNVQGNCTFSVTFAPTPANFTVTPSVISGSGSISPASPQNVVSGASISFTLTPSPGYVLANLQGSCSGNVVNNVFTTGPITADCTVGAIFAANANVQATAVPTLSQWALLLLGAIAALLGVVNVSRRRSARPRD